jgi:hypothetical protein
VEQSGVAVAGTVGISVAIAIAVTVYVATSTFSVVVAPPPQLVMTNAMIQNNNSIRFIKVLQKNNFVRR